MATVVHYFFVLTLGIFLRGSHAELQDAGPRDYMFHVSLRSGAYGEHVCGGSILTQKWVVTTADCANKIKNNPFILAGSIYLQATSPRAKILQVNRVVIHERFSPQSFENNIGLLEMKETIEYNDNTVNTKLPIIGAALPDSASLCGWQPKDSNNPNVNRILKVLSDLKLVKNNCKTAGGVDVSLNSEEFCGFDQSTQSSACLSDLGGALTKDQVLHGLLSRTDCIMQPEIFVQISTYSDWIKNSLGDDASDIKWDNNYPGTGGDGGGGGASAAEFSTFLVAVVSCLCVLIRSF